MNVEDVEFLTAVMASSEAYEQGKGTLLEVSKEIQSHLEPLNLDSVVDKEKANKLARDQVEQGIEKFRDKLIEAGKTVKSSAFADFLSRQEKPEGQQKFMAEMRADKHREAQVYRFMIESLVDTDDPITELIILVEGFELLSEFLAQN